MENEKTSLEKSHSKWSNFKLTCLCLLITISLSTIWVMIAFLKFIDIAYFILITVISLIVLVLTKILLKQFKR